QEPPIDAIFSEQSCLEFKRVITGKSTLPDRSHLLRIVGMNYSTNHVHRPILVERQTCVFPRDPICVHPLAVGSQHHNDLRNEIHKLLKLLLRTLTLGYIDHGTHEFTQAAGSVEDRMAYDVNVPDPFVRMNDSVPEFEIRLVADGLLEPFPARSLIVGMNSLKEFFESR